MKIHKLIGPLALLAALLFPSLSLAAGSSETIQSEYNDAFDYLEYYSEGAWHDLNTPRHWIESTGEICYCVQHSYANPHGERYAAVDPSAVFSSYTLSGIQAILMNGYPCITPPGFTADEARQATANALRFWLSDRGENGSYSFTDRAVFPDRIRAKPGYEHVLTWADELLSYARAGYTGFHDIRLSPDPLTLTKSEQAFTGTLNVTLENINSGYTLSDSGLPEGTSVSGYTGKNSEELTVTAPLSAAGESFSLTVSGKDTRSLENITAYLPSNSSYQDVFLCVTTERIVASASVSVSTPSTGGLTILKENPDLVPVSGTKFSVYSDDALSDLLAEGETGSDGRILFSVLPSGTVFLKENATVPPYIRDTEIRTVTVPAGESTEIRIENTPAMGRIRVHVGEEDPDGTQTYNLEGIRVGVFTAAGEPAAELTTGADGYAETGLLPLGGYTVRVLSEKEDSTLQESTHTISLDYLNDTTPVVCAETGFVFRPNRYRVQIKKLRERFDPDTETVLTVPYEGCRFGICPADGLKLPIYEIETDETGIGVTETDLPAGNYILFEISAPETDTLEDNTEYPFTLSGPSGVFKRFYTTPLINRIEKARITVLNKDEKTGELLSGGTFTIRSAGGYEKTFRMSDSMYFTTPYLPAGSYTVVQNSAKDGYLKNSRVFSVRLSREDQTVTVLNGTVDLFFTRLDAMTDEPIPGAAITVYKDGAYYTESVTDENGNIKLEKLAPGSYTYTETKGLPGYACNPRVYAFRVSETGEITGELTAYDDPTGLVLKKTDAKSGSPLSCAGFQIKVRNGLLFSALPFTKLPDGSYRYSPDGKAESILTGADGTLTFYGIPEGEVWIEETVTPEGYFAISATKADITSETTFRTPLTVHLKNSPFVKLGKDSDKWNIPIAVTAVLFLSAGVSYLIFRKKQKKRG